MYSTDMIVLLASKTSGPVTALDLWSIAEDTPPQDTAFGGTYDLILESYKYTDTGFLAAVSRRLNTGDRYDAVITPNSTISMVCATESEKSWIEHDIKTSITVFLSQEAPSVESDATSIDDDRKTHGLIMTVM